MSTKSPTTLFMAMTAVQASTKEIANLSLSLDEVYDKLKASLFANSLLATCSVQDTIQSGEQLRLGAEWTFRFGNGDAIVSRAVVVLPCLKLSNDLLLKAQKLSLLQVFMLTINPVDEVNKHLESNGQKPLVTADQLQTKTPQDFADASRKRKAWVDAVPMLNPKKPDDWTAHAVKLKDLPGQDEDFQKELFREMKRIAHEKGLAFNSDMKKFYPAHVEASA